MLSFSCCPLVFWGFSSADNPDTLLTPSSLISEDIWLLHDFPSDRSVFVLSSKVADNAAIAGKIRTKATFPHSFVRSTASPSRTDSYGSHDRKEIRPEMPRAHSLVRLGL